VTACISLWLALPHAVLAQTGIQEDKAPGSAGSSPAVDMDRLLKLPGSFEQPPEAKGGVTLDQWQGRFDRVLVDFYTANRALTRAQAELEEMAVEGGSWSMAAPGTKASSENAPMSFKLRQEMRRQREAVERSEKRLRELQVQADLAGVPADWRREHSQPITDAGDERLRGQGRNL
jgi:hypothetical protein